MRFSLQVSRLKLCVPFLPFSIPININLQQTMYTFLSFGDRIIAWSHVRLGFFFSSTESPYRVWGPSNLPFKRCHCGISSGITDLRLKPTSQLHLVSRSRISETPYLPSSVCVPKHTGTHLPYLASLLSHVCHKWTPLKQICLFQKLDSFYENKIN